VFTSEDERNKHERDKLLGWDMSLTEFKYTIRHITRKSNMWIGMLSRWTVAMGASAFAARSGLSSTSSRSNNTISGRCSP
jgi:hypothetical protein